MVFWGHVAFACLSSEVLSLLRWTLAAPDRVEVGLMGPMLLLLMGTRSLGSAEV